MKLLLDENLPVDLRHDIKGHECITVAYQEWRGIKNGELLALASEAGFDALLTNDGNLPYQQNRSDLPLAVVVLNAKSNDIDDVGPLVPALLKTLENLRPNVVTLVESRR